MKKKELKTLREKTVKELEAQVEKLRLGAELAYAKTKVGQEKNVKKFRNERKDIAQILTIIKEKEIIERSKNKK